MSGEVRPLIVVHGGCGIIGNITPERDAICRAALEDSLRAGYAVLSSGGSAVDAVIAATVLLEDCPEYNAGKGAVFASDGNNELDSGIMDGHTGAAGGISTLKCIKNPILAARHVMLNCPHTLLCGTGAETFAVNQGCQIVDQKYFFTEQRFLQLQSVLADANLRPQLDHNIPTNQLSTNETSIGTVGAVALDQHGRLATASSTGGMTGKLPGRVSDSSIVGAGFFADQQLAVSMTGTGDEFIRQSAARQIVDLFHYRSMTLTEACDQVIFGALKEVHAGVIAVDREGNMLVELLIGVAIAVWLLFGLLSSSRRWWKRPTLPEVDNTPSNTNNTICSSSDCVRCHRNESTLAAARHKFTQRYQDRTDLTRIQEVLMPTAAVDSPYLFFIHFNRSMPIWTNSLPDCYKDDIELLEAEWYSIASDYKAVRSSEIGWGKNTNDKGERKWKVFQLMNQGSWVTVNCERCPQVVAILHRLSNIVTNCTLGNAFFSVLPAGTVIAAHRGPTNARLRCHLGIDVPLSAQKGASMDVGDASFSWVNGKCVVFDDSYLHSARYLNGERERAALIVDLWHPDLVKEEKECVEFVFGVVVEANDMD
uniref:Aspartyl/asparaginy/proline hydroxylase domain-containing protein n=1 Tax=Plectus sambesii TaxID=2011161 RepID=A0A914WCM4_9BILA